MTLAAGTTSTSVDEDTAVAYDIMRETATRLIGAHAALLPEDPTDPAHEAGLQSMIAVRRAARAVPTRDTAEIAAARELFERRLQALRSK